MANSLNVPIIRIYSIAGHSKGEVEHVAKRMMKFPTINESLKFQIRCFKPNAITFKAAPLICVCEEYKKDYGSCSLFEEYPLEVQTLKQVYLRSPDADMAENNVLPTEFFLPDSIVAIAAAEESVETTWFIKILDQNVVVKETIKDFYGNVALAGQSYLKGYFLEKQTNNSKRLFL